MTTTPDTPAATWRDLADQLTVEQVAYIEYWERHPELPPMVDGSSPSHAHHQETLLFSARGFVQRNAVEADGLAELQ